MKLLIFSLLLCLGASLKGQDSGRTNDTCWQKTAGIVNIVPCPANARLEISQATDGGITYYGHGPMCRPGKSGELVCMAENPAPVDVPAIQEDNTDPHGLLHECHYDRSADGITCSNLKHWTCSDPHNYALLTSVDGEIHTCHRISQ